LKPAPKVKAAKPEASAWGAEQRAHFYGELKCYAQRQGYRDGWAANKYKERVGVWPNAHKDAPLQVPSPETLSWIKSRAIAWAKSKARSFQHAAE
jgi:DNA repair protein RadD